MWLGGGTAAATRPVQPAAGGSSLGQLVAVEGEAEALVRLVRERALAPRRPASKTDVELFRELRLALPPLSDAKERPALSATPQTPTLMLPTSARARGAPPLKASAALQLEHRFAVAAEVFHRFDAPCVSALGLGGPWSPRLDRHFGVAETMAKTGEAAADAPGDSAVAAEMLGSGRVLICSSSAFSANGAEQDAGAPAAPPAPQAAPAKRVSIALRPAVEPSSPLGSNLPTVAFPAGAAYRPARPAFTRSRTNTILRPDGRPAVRGTDPMAGSLFARDANVSDTARQKGLYEAALRSAVGKLQ